MANAPTREAQQTLAFLMTDVEASTRLWESDRGAMAELLPRIEAIAAETIERNGGRLIKSRGEGDSFFAVFSSVNGAITGATEIMLALQKESPLQPVKIRAAIHAGSPESWSGDFYGPTINRCARIRQATHPGQILISEAVHALASAHDSFKFRYLGVHCLKDLMQPERLYQVLHPDLPHRFPPPETLSVLSHNLPVSPTSFVGRELDIVQLCQLVRDHRLSVVTGTGGVGKTRLALQVAAECVEFFKDGAWFIDLAQTERSQSVLPIVCSVLDPSSEPTEEALRELIGHRHMLLVLDNCEHLHEECRRLGTILLQGCPNLHVLATSRRVLEVKGEYVYKLAGLSIPEGDEMEEALRSDAVRLFLERAEHRATGLKLNEETMRGIVQLCRQVDGLPLALEMVSSLTDLLSVSEICRSLGEYLETPIELGSGDLRQQTMASTIDWSRRLVSPDARNLLSVATVFPNTWSLEAARRVCLPDLPAGRVQALVRELVNHSLLYSVRTVHDDVRLGLLQTTRQVVGATAEFSPDLIARFISYCEMVTTDAERLVKDGEEQRAQEQIDLEWENLMKGLELSYESAPGSCVIIALALKPFWMRGTCVREGRDWYERLSQWTTISAGSKISVQLALSSLYILLGENDLALAVLLEAEKAVEPIGGYDLAVVVGNLTLHKDRMGWYAEARGGCERACELFREFGSPAEEALALLNFGVVKLRLDEPLEESADLYRKALDRAQQGGSVSMQAKAHSSLAHVEKLAGRFDASLRHSADALKLWQSAPYLPDCALEMIGLSETFFAMSLFESSVSALQTAERLEELSQSPFPARHRPRVSSLKEALRINLPACDFRSAARAVRGKSATELASSALRLIEDAGALADD